MIRFLTLALALIAAGSAGAQDIRVVTYNTANDVSGHNNVDYLPRTGASDVLKAIGFESVTPNAPARPVDILALQESVYYSGTGINPTAQGYVNVLNGLYGTAANPSPYAAATLNGKTDGNLTGNGPQTLIYNTTTVQLIGQWALGTPSGSGVARQVMEYEFQPVGYSSASDFYLFNDHFKSGSTASDLSRRGVEGNLVASAANALPAGSSILYAGDYNPTSNANDPGYLAVTAAGSHGNQGVDPLSGNFTSLQVQTASPATTASFTGQSTTGMRYRDDLLLNSPAVADGTGALGLIDGSVVAFGNTGTHTNHQAITTGSASALANELTAGRYSPSQAATILSDLTKVSDHLPLVADYRINAVPEPSSILLLLAGATGGLGFFRRRTRRPRMS